MKPTTLLPLTLGITACLVIFEARFASADKAPKNLKVLKTDTDKKVLEKSMKELSKGLGVKCIACHIKGKFDSDEVKAKDATRDFFTVAIGQADAAKKDAALKALLPALKLEAAKDAALVWNGLKLLESSKK
jgi:hypothetical protein